MKQKKTLPYIIGVAVVIIIVLIVGKKQGWLGSDVSVKVATETVESKTITEFITANGKIQPETEVKISPDVAGEIVELHVEDGDAVEQGK
uniref:biotin/lipoyl-binding protein n=1 Tax=Draconibacterium sp. TaxID=1965318 RepID=UPI003567EE4D